MSEENKTAEIAVKNSQKMADAIKKNVTAENIQKYILGTKKNGAPRAVYDVVKDFAKPKKKGKKKKKKHVQSNPMLEFYVSSKKKKKKKKKGKGKHWKYNG